MAVLATGVTRIPPPYPSPAQPWVDVPVPFNVPYEPPTQLGMVATVQLAPFGGPPTPPPLTYACSVVRVTPNLAVVRVHVVSAGHAPPPNVLFLAWAIVG